MDRIVRARTATSEQREEWIEMHEKLKEVYNNIDWCKESWSESSRVRESGLENETEIFFFLAEEEQVQAFGDLRCGKVVNLKRSHPPSLANVRRWPGCS